MPRMRFYLPIILMLVLGACGTAEIERLKREVIASQDQLAQCKFQNETTTSRLATCEQSLESCTQTSTATQGDLDRIKAQLGQTEGSLADQKRLLEALRVQQEAAEKRLAQFRELTEKLRSMIDSGKLKVSVRDGQMVISLPDRVLFDPGRTDLKTEGQAAIAQVAQALREFPDRRFQVLGHTDNLPIRTQRFPSNWELSTARAVVVTKFLIENGVDAKRLIAAGASEFQPVALNEDEFKRAQNRRIEIVLLPNISELPDVSTLEK